MKIVIVGLILLFIKANGQNTIQNCDLPLVLWTFNSGNFIMDNAHRITSKRWGFTTASKMGDILIDSTWIEKVEHHNETIWTCLKKQGVDNPRFLYENQVRAEANRIQDVLEIAKFQPRILILQTALKNEWTSTQMKIINEDSYTFAVETVGSLAAVPQFEYTINLRSKIVESIKVSPNFTALDVKNIIEKETLQRDLVLCLAPGAIKDSYQGVVEFVPIHGSTGSREKDKINFFKILERYAVNGMPFYFKLMGQADKPETSGHPEFVIQYDSN